MAFRLAKKDLEEILKPLPLKDRKLLMEQEFSIGQLEETIDKHKQLMKRDAWIGLPWFVIYSVALFTTGIGVLSVGIFVIGMIYFITTSLSTGSYGLNRKRVKVFETLLEKLKK